MLALTQVSWGASSAYQCSPVESPDIPPGCGDALRVANRVAPEDVPACECTPGPARPLLDQLRALYPERSKAELETQLAGLSEFGNPRLKLLRTFVPLYYARVAANACRIEAVRTLWRHSGWCAGDAHLENFGALIGPDAKTAVFTLNDIDDAGPCPLVSDALRFFVSVRLHGDELGPLITAYRAGLEGKPHAYSGPVQALLDESVQKGMASKKGFPAAKSEEGGKELSPGELKELDAAVRGAYPAGSRLLDAYRLDRDSGGSAGMRRFEVQVQWPGRPDPVWIEFKETGSPGISPLKRGEIPAVSARARRTLELERGGKPPVEYQVARVLGMDMLLRPRWRGNVGVDLKQIKEKKLPDVLADEAYALGTMHSRSPGAADYSKAVAQLPPKSWIESADSVIRDLSELYAGSTSQH